MRFLRAGLCADGARDAQGTQNPSEDDIRHYLAGNLCRCSGYEGQSRAIKKYLEAVHA